LSFWLKAGMDRTSVYGRFLPVVQVATGQPAVGLQRTEQDKRFALEQRLQHKDQTHHKELTDEQAKQTRLRYRLATADLRLSVVLAATDAGDQGLIAQRACQAYAKKRSLYTEVKGAAGQDASTSKPGHLPHRLPLQVQPRLLLRAQSEASLALCIHTKTFLLFMSTPITPWMGGKLSLADRLITLFAPHAGLSPQRHQWRPSAL
jgi:hypothetical protein